MLGATVPRRPEACQNTKMWTLCKYENEITTLRIIYHQKGLNEEILDHQTKLRKMYSILRYKRNTIKVS